MTTDGVYRVGKCHRSPLRESCAETAHMKRFSVQPLLTLPPPALGKFPPSSLDSRGCGIQTESRTRVRQSFPFQLGTPASYHVARGESDLLGVMGNSVR